MEAGLARETFAQHVNSVFRVQVDDTKQVELQLVELSELKLYPAQEEFSLIFRGPSETFLGQGTRSFTHDQMGEFVIFIVPISKDETGYYYEAIFNRLRM